MPKKTIFRGSVANDGTGDNLRFGAEKINDNFTELYTLLGDGSTLSAGTIVTTTETQTITNKTIDGSNNTITNIPASALAFNSITIGDDTSTNFNVELGGSFEIVGGSGINTAITNNRIELSTDGSIVTESSTDTLTNKTINDANNTLTINSSNSTITIDGTQATLSNIANSSLDTIQNSKLANSHIRIGDDSSTNFNVNLGDSFEITGGTGITTAIDNNRIVLTASSIPNSSLTNSSITLGSDAISLGGSITTITGLSLDGTGTIDLTGAGSKARFDFAGFGSLPAFGTYQGMFAFDSVGNRPYYSSGSGWVRLLDENASVSAHTDVNITGIADGYILQWSSSDGRFNSVANTSATNLTVSDDSSTSGTIALSTETLGFIGTSGITTSIDPGNKTITISGAGISSGISNVVEDTTPQLGGNLDTQGNDVQDVGYVSHRSPDATVTQTLTVTVATKTSEHTAFGDGSSSGYVIDGHEGAHLHLSPGVYKFDLSDSSNSGHPFRLYRESDKTTAYTTNVTTSGSGGSGGDHLTITITEATPSTLHYQCSSHANMGGRINVTGSEAPTIRMPDNDKIFVGTGNDLEIFHNATDSIIENKTGDLILRTPNSESIFLRDAGGNNLAQFNDGGAVNLYHNASIKLATSSTGIDVTGEVLADKAYIAETTLTDGATINWDMSTQSVCKVTLGGNRTLAAPTNGSTGQFASILVIQDGTGSRTLTWNAVYEFASDTAPTLTTTASLGDLFTFRYNGSKWLEVGRNQALTLS